MSMATRRFFPNLAIPVTSMNSPAMAMNSQAMTRSPMLTNHHLHLQTASNSLIYFFERLIQIFSKQVFEDEENGVLCYRDERGELICEGSDEGPRLSSHSNLVLLAFRSFRLSWKIMSLKVAASMNFLEDPCRGKPLAGG